MRVTHPERGYEGRFNLSQVASWAQHIYHMLNLLDVLNESQRRKGVKREPVKDSAGADLARPRAPAGEKRPQAAGFPACDPGKAAERRCARAGSRPSPASQDCTAAGERFGGSTGPLGGPRRRRDAPLLAGVSGWG